MVRSQAMLFIGIMIILLWAGHASTCGTTADQAAEDVEILIPDTGLMIAGLDNLRRRGDGDGAHIGANVMKFAEEPGAPPSKTGWLRRGSGSLLDLDADKQNVKAHSNDVCDTASSSEEIDNAPYFGIEIDKEARPGSWDDIQSAFKLWSGKSKEFSIRPSVKTSQWDTTKWTDKEWPQKLKEAIDTFVQSKDWDDIYYRVDYYWGKSRLWVSDSHGHTYHVASAICDGQGLPGIIKGDREHNKPHPAAVCGSPDDIKGALKSMHKLRYRKTTGLWGWASIASDDAGWETVKGTIPSWAKSKEGELIWYAIGENHQKIFVFDSDRVAHLVALTA